MNSIGPSWLLRALASHAPTCPCSQAPATSMRYLVVRCVCGGGVWRMMAGALAVIAYLLEHVTLRPHV